MSMIYAKGPDGTQVPVACDAAGNLLTVPGATDSDGLPFNPALGTNTTEKTSDTITETNVQDGVTRVRVTTFDPGVDNWTTMVEGTWELQP
jgi:hypothetical protein